MSDETTPEQPAEPPEPVEPPAEVAVVPNRGISSPEVRKAVYGVAAAIGALLLIYGLVSPEQVDAWLKVISTIITVLPLVLAFINTPRGGAK